MPKDKTKSNQKNWCFTDHEKADLDQYIHPEVRFVVIGEETAPTTGQVHWQGFIQFKTKKRLSWIKKYISAAAHFEPCAGTAQQNYDYCTKDGNIVLEHGDMVGKGQRTDLESLRTALKAGQSDLELFESNFATMIRYHRGITVYRALLDQSFKRPPPTIYIYYSAASGTGKSSTARLNFPNAYVHPLGRNEWWDGYDGEREVVFDEWRCQISYTRILQILDAGRCTVEVKGGSKILKASTFVFTTNKTPTLWYSDGVADRSALLRRLKDWAVIVEFPTEMAHQWNVLDAPATP